MPSPNCPLILRGLSLLGFNYRFDALREDGKPNELNDAYKEIFSADVHPNMFSRLQIMIPILAKVVSPSDAVSLLSGY